MVVMASMVPKCLHRTPLWEDTERQEGSLMLTPMGAVKQISNFKAFARRHGVTQESLEDAYKAAAAAAQQRKDQGLKPFLVAARAGPHFSRHGLEVHTTPLGYSRRIKTEAVRMLQVQCRSHGLVVPVLMYQPPQDLVVTVWRGRCPAASLMGKVRH